MRPLFPVLPVGAALLAAALLAPLRVAPWLLTLVVVAAGVLLAGIASGAASSLAVAFGALGALGASALAPHSLPLAGGVLCAFAFGARALRAPSARGSLAHLGASLLGGTGGAWLTELYARSAPPSLLAAALVAGMLGSISLLLPADDPLAHGLAAAAEDLPAAPRIALLRGAALRRDLAALAPPLPRAAARRIHQALAQLLSLAASRRGAPPAAVAVLDGRIEAHALAAERLFSAATETHAREARLDDAQLTALCAAGDALSAEAAALAEVDPLPPPPLAPPGGQG